MASVKGQDLEAVKTFLKSVNSLKFNELNEQKQLVSQSYKIRNFLRKDTYSFKDAEDLERVYESSFHIELQRGWLRLYLYKLLGEYDLDSKQSSAADLFDTITGVFVSGTDTCEPCRCDIVKFENGQIVRCALNSVYFT